MMKRFFAFCLMAAINCMAAMAIDVNYKLSLKQPGNNAVSYELKADEEGLVDLCGELRVPFKTYSAAELSAATR